MSEDRIGLILVPAIRQYRHNNSDEFVVAYDVGETRRIVEALQAENEKLRDLIAPLIETESRYATEWDQAAKLVLGAEHE